MGARRSARGGLAVGLAAGLGPRPLPARASAPPAAPRIAYERAPDRAGFDPSDRDLARATEMGERALAAPTPQAEEAAFTELIEAYGGAEFGGRAWSGDVLARAHGNRGNVRARLGRFEEALADYDESIRLAPWAVDPVLNKGATLETLRRYDEAEGCYRAILAVQPKDPAAWNNLGNVQLMRGEWRDAVDSFSEAVDLAPQFSFVRCNLAIAYYEGGEGDSASERILTNLLRRYPEFQDARAALAMMQWAGGQRAEAEDSWTRVEDARYRSLEWLEGERRWPPRLLEAARSFLDLKSSA